MSCKRPFIIGDRTGRFDPPPVYENSEDEMVDEMTPTEKEDVEIAKEAYALWRGSQRSKVAPPAWDDLEIGWRDSYRIVVAHARHHELAKRLN